MKNQTPMELVKAITSFMQFTGLAIIFLLMTIVLNHNAFPEEVGMDPITARLLFGAAFAAFIMIAEARIASDLLERIEQ